MWALFRYRKKANLAPSFTPPNLWVSLMLPRHDLASLTIRSSSRASTSPSRSKHSITPRSACLSLTLDARASICLAVSTPGMGSSSQSKLTSSLGWVLSAIFESLDATREANPCHLLVSSAPSGLPGTWSGSPWYEVQKSSSSETPARCTTDTTLRQVSLASSQHALSTEFPSSLSRSCKYKDVYTVSARKLPLYQLASNASKPSRTPRRMSYSSLSGARPAARRSAGVPQLRASGIEPTSTFGSPSSIALTASRRLKAGGCTIPPGPSPV
mmetsp:Transcript_7278/g.25049  ORF Transcript_7278/g.25049 Transcript_7278/m.25049 type:complete len:271 (+) Transcript_7278:1349-2161(+)